MDWESEMHDWVKLLRVCGSQNENRVRPDTTWTNPPPTLALSLLFSSPTPCPG